jgi:phage baseplate assembly protein W
VSERYLKFPFALTPEGGVATVDADRHVRELIEQVLFTSPGERVMLPEFGAGLMDLVFAPSNDVLIAAAEFKVARALQTFLADRALIHAVDVRSEGERVTISVVYTRARDLKQETAAFEFLPTRGMQP